MAEQFFHLTIGPVQDFVAQARRTRDFWAGSFILSYLSSIAMIAVRQQGGQIEFPVPDENFLNWLEHGQPQSNHILQPKQGSVPNRFKAMEVRVASGFDPQHVVNAVNIVWRGLAEQVWRHDIAPMVGNDNVHRQVWERQINSFWEINWCLTADRFASNLIDRRKNWRNHIINDEPGVKCSLMEGYQELSGAVRFGRALHNFWRDLRAQNKQISRDIREDEHLCAIAFVKRRFVHVFAQLALKLPAVSGESEKAVYGWALPTSVPSIAYMAATPWLAASIRSSSNNASVLEAIGELEQILKQLDAPWEGQVSPYVQQACEEAGYRSQRWRQVDGQYLFAPAVQQALNAADQDNATQDEKALLRDVAKWLHIINDASGLGQPSPFYAILLMDGDALGVQMSEATKQKGISIGLNMFTAAVPEIVERHSGFLVYAGGDDVLAILPQPFALDCAQDIRQFYDQCFTKVNQGQGDAPIITSISAAINFAHYKTPLTAVLEDVHQLLGGVAKEQTGRNSLAVRLHKPGGLNAQWSAPWPYVPAMQKISQQVAKHLHGDLSRAFFFKLEALITSLRLEEKSHGFSETSIQALVRTAWTYTGNKLDSLPANMELNLLEACRMVTRSLEGATEYFHDSDAVFAPGALRLIQFLATENQQFLRTATDTQEVSHG